jgi:SAM-dependent methyltransferase
MPPYTALAASYDAVMDHVDYAGWAGFVHRLLRRHRPGVEDVLELGCGTGSLALELQPKGDYTYCATDHAPAMLAVARSKAPGDAPIQWQQADFTALAESGAHGAAPFDAAVLVYDGLNYLLDAGAVQGVFRGVRGLLRPGGLFVFDHSTPANSEDHADAFADRGQAGAWAYERTSRYDPETRRHVTEFVLTSETETVRERHVQRAYAVGEMATLLDQSPLAPVRSYDGWSEAPAGPRTHRAHWVARRPR